MRPFIGLDFFFLGFCVLKGVSVFCFVQGDDGRIDQTKGKKEEGNKMIKKNEAKAQGHVGKSKTF